MKYDITILFSARINIFKLIGRKIVWGAKILLMCTQLCENLVPDPGHAIPCHARIESRSAPHIPGSTHTSARAVMALVLHLVAAPHEPLDTNCGLGPSDTTHS